MGNSSKNGIVIYVLNKNTWNQPTLLWKADTHKLMLFKSRTIIYKLGENNRQKINVSFQQQSTNYLLGSHRFQVEGIMTD